jgi:hypothetical protein
MINLEIILNSIIAFMVYHVITSVILGIISYRRAKAAQKVLEKFFSKGEFPLSIDPYESMLDSHTKKGTDEPPKTH